MKYKCRECGKVYVPGVFSGYCPKCGSSDAEVIYEHVHVPQTKMTQQQE